MATVAVGEQGNALPQASLIKGRFGGIVNISLIMIMCIIMINCFAFAQHRRCDFMVMEACEFIYKASITIK